MTQALSSQASTLLNNCFPQVSEENKALASRVSKAALAAFVITAVVFAISGSVLLFAAAALTGTTAGVAYLVSKQAGRTLGSSSEDAPASTPPVHTVPETSSTEMQGTEIPVVETSSTDTSAELVDMDEQLLQQVLLETAARSPRRASLSAAYPTPPSQPDDTLRAADANTDEDEVRDPIPSYTDTLLSPADFVSQQQLLDNFGLTVGHAPQGPSTPEVGQLYPMDETMPISPEVEALAASLMQRLEESRSQASVPASVPAATVDSSDEDDATVVTGESAEPTQVQAVETVEEPEPVDCQELSHNVYLCILDLYSRGLEAEEAFATNCSQLITDRARLCIALEANETLSNEVVTAIQQRLEETRCSLDAHLENHPEMPDPDMRARRAANFSVGSRYNQVLRRLTRERAEAQEASQ